MKRFKTWPGSAPPIRTDDLKELQLPDLLGVMNWPRKADGPDSRNDDQLPIVPDVRELWEPARLQFLTQQFTLFTASDETNRNGSLVEQAAQWLRLHPFPRGPFYKSSMECGLRVLAPSFLFEESLLFHRERLPGGQRRPLPARIVDFKEPESVLLKLGNHTIAEATGLGPCGWCISTYG